MEAQSGAEQVEEGIEAAFEQSRSRVISWGFVYRFPWWALALIIFGIWVSFSITADELYSHIFDQLRAGIAMTLRVAISSYVLGFTFGLIVGMIRSSSPQPRTGIVGRIRSLVHLILYNVATLYVMVMRGLPVIIVLLIFAFVLVPAIRVSLAEQWDIKLEMRGSSAESAILALAVAYGAFLSETLRAGIQSIDRGQIEAARALGMNYLQTMRHVVLPQAIRRVVPPLGNDFIAIIKDSSLVAILGIRDLTQLAKVNSGSSFRYMETYLTTAFIYLSLTIIGAMIVRYIERRVSFDK